MRRLATLLALIVATLAALVPVPIPRRTGYRMRFTAVRVGGAPLPCVSPQGRGVFGLAVLTKERIHSSHDAAFGSHAGREERRWLCVTTADAVTVCTAHLGTRESIVASRANDAECAERRGVLTRYDEAGATVFGGDVNRRQSCASSSMWATEDAPAAHTDHDFFAAVGRLAVSSR